MVRELLSESACCPSDILGGVLPGAYKIVALTVTMFVLPITLACERHDLSQSFARGHKSPSLLDKFVIVYIPKVDSAALGDCRVHVVLASELLTNRESPGLTSFSEFHCHMYAILSAHRNYT